jgi:hypothetical protein
MHPACDVIVGLQLGERPALCLTISIFYLIVWYQTVVTLRKYLFRVKTYLT